MTPFTDIFSEFVALLLLAVVLGVVSVRLRQPLIIGFIAVGILAGPSGLNWIRSTVQVHLLAEMGLAMLLFVVGLKLDLHLIRSMGPVALAAGIGQVVFTILGGLLVAWSLGMSFVPALYVSVALTFSSTIIIVKLLSDKRETDALHGRIALGILIVQDIMVVLTMILLSAFGNGNGTSLGVQMAMALVKGACMLVGVGLAGYVVLPRLVPVLARSTELLVLFSIAWALALAGVGDHLGLTKEVGAFLAGVSLASTDYREILGARLVALRDFLLFFFFLELGSRLNLGVLGAQIGSSVALSLFVLIGNPLIVMAIMGYLGYRRRTSLMTGLTVAQISEFSLILIAMGAKFGHVGADSVGVVTLVGLITIGLSTYLILYAQRIYEWVGPYLGIFERKVPYREDTSKSQGQESSDPHIILFGLGRYGSRIGEELVARDLRVLGVDFDPQAVRAWNERGWPAIYGDAEDPEFAASLPLDKARWVVSSVRDAQINRAISKALEHAGYRGAFAVSVEDRAGAERAAATGADLVLVPFEDAAEYAVELLIKAEEEIARRDMDRLIDSITEHYIVCGFGRMGQQICKDLGRQGVPCVVVESNPEQLPRLKESGIPHVVGSASDDAVLTRAGITRAKGLIAVAASDEDNVFIVLTGRVLNPRLFIVARSILEENEDKLRRAGANRVISPYILGGRRMAAAVMKPGVMDFLDLVLHSDSVDAEITHTVVAANSAAARSSLLDLNLWQRCGVTVLAVKQPGEGHTVNPCPELMLRPGSELILMGPASSVTEALRILTEGD